MCGFLNSHGDNTNLFDGTFMSLNECWRDDEDEFMGKKSFTPIDEIAVDYYWLESATDEEHFLDTEVYEYWPDIQSSGIEDMAEELSLSIAEQRRLGQDDIIKLWIEARYGEYLDGYVLPPERVAKSPQWGQLRHNADRLEDHDYRWRDETWARQPHRKGKRHALPWKICRESVRTAAATLATPNRLSTTCWIRSLAEF